MQQAAAELRRLHADIALRNCERAKHMRNVDGLRDR
jgi:hypothetical protein